MKTCPHSQGNYSIDSMVSLIFLIHEQFALKQKSGGEGKEK